MKQHIYCCVHGNIATSSKLGNSNPAPPSQSSRVSVLPFISKVTTKSRQNVFSKTAFNLGKKQLDTAGAPKGNRELASTLTTPMLPQARIVVHKVLSYHVANDGKLTMLVKLLKCNDGKHCKRHEFERGIVRPAMQARNQNITALLSYSVAVSGGKKSMEQFSVPNYGLCDSPGY